MRPIPLKMREKLDRDPLMHFCAVAHLGGCSQGVQWHHVWEYGADGQINEAWAILAACPTHHGMVDGSRIVREEFHRISLRMATEEDLAKYPRKDWEQLRGYLSTG